MAKITDLRGRCSFCKKLTPNMVDRPEDIPEGWSLIPDPQKPTTNLLCCPDCKVKSILDALTPGFKYGVPF